MYGQCATTGNITSMQSSKVNNLRVYTAVLSNIAVA